MGRYPCYGVAGHRVEKGMTMVTAPDVVRQHDMFGALPGLAGDAGEPRGLPIPLLCGVVALIAILIVSPAA
jgi:hypothetical protein